MSSSTLSLLSRRCGRRTMAPALTTAVTNSLLLFPPPPRSPPPPRRRWQSSSTAGQQSELPLTTPPQNAPTPLMDRSNKNIFERMYAKYSMKQQTHRILVAESLLQAALSQASDPRWFGPGRIARDFRSFQALLTMHIWLLHKRLISDDGFHDPYGASLIQEELFDIFWTDSSNRMRAHGVTELLIQKNLKTVQQYTFMHCFHYDHCYTELLDNPKERLKELKNLIKTHVLLLNPDEDVQAMDDHDDHAERIAWYVEAQYQNIVHDLPEDLFGKARIAWVDLPDFSKMKDAKGKEMEELAVDPQDILPSKWIRNIANDGSYYYWNLETRESQWERPSDATNL